MLNGKHGRKRPMGKPRCRWEDNIKEITLKRLSGKAGTAITWLRI
jgi:hypothetical protein